MTRALLLLGLLSLWAFAAAAWPGLPERVPTHFGASGVPDAWSDKSAWAWFLLPGLATATTLPLGLLLPALVVGMARRNSALLNVPQRERFRALPEAARVRAVRALSGGLVWIALAMQGLFGWIQFATAEVAHGRWRALPTAPSLAFVGVVLAAAIASTVAASRAVGREVDATRGDGSNFAS